MGSTDSIRRGNDSGFHVYYVKDNGLGIPEAYHQRVFTAFNRLHANVAQGEGIGLALVRRMVERHGGKIWLESAAGVGTTFFVALPAPPPDGLATGRFWNGRPATQIPKGEDSYMAAEPILIVLVEDDDGHAELVERNLKRAGRGQRHPSSQGRPGGHRLRPGQGSLWRPDHAPSRCSSCSTSRCRESTAWKCSVSSSPIRRRH